MKKEIASKLQLDKTLKKVVQNTIPKSKVAPPGFKPRFDRKKSKYG